MYDGKLMFDRQKRILHYVTCYIYIKGITSQLRPLSERLLESKLKECGKHEIRIGCCEGFRKYPVFCGIRICRVPGCVSSRDKKTVTKYYGYVANMASPIFLTVTLRGHHSLGYNPKNRLDKAFNSLVRYYKGQKIASGGPIWGGYIKVLEIERKEDGFYYHLHVIYDGVRISETILSKKWQEYTTDSYVVDVRPITNPAEAVSYVTKYCTKAYNLDLSVIEYSLIRKMRFLSSYGCQSKFKKEKRSVCPVCGDYLKVLL